MQGPTWKAGIVSDPKPSPKMHPKPSPKFEFLIVSRYSLNMKIIMAELKTPIFHFTKLSKDDNSPVTYRPGVLSVIEKPTELADNSYLPLGGLFLFEI